MSAFDTILDNTRIADSIQVNKTKDACAQSTEV